MEDFSKGDPLPSLGGSVDQRSIDDNPFERECWWRCFAGEDPWEGASADEATARLRSEAGRHVDLDVPEQRTEAIFGDCVLRVIASGVRIEEQTEGLNLSRTISMTVLNCLPKDTPDVDGHSLAVGRGRLG